MRKAANIGNAWYADGVTRTSQFAIPSLQHTTSPNYISLHKQPQRGELFTFFPTDAPIYIYLLGFKILFACKPKNPV